MKNLFLIILLIPVYSFSQLYDWTTNVNPGWTSSNSSNNTLSWQNSITTVSTSGFNNGTGNWYTYNNSQINTYTSPNYDFTPCAPSSFVQLSIKLDVNLETGYDWLYFQYSTNGGVTWINPNPNSSSVNNSGVNLFAYSPQTTWSSNASNRNGWTGGLGNINPIYIIPNTANKFRFIFESDPSVNSYNIGINNYIYYADILDFTVSCINPLPVELAYFGGSNLNNYNQLQWGIYSETNCDYYKIERSNSGYEWNTVTIVKASNLTEYKIYDNNYSTNSLNYYRLSQIDFDGKMHTYSNELVVVDNRTNVKIVKIYNLLGQEVDENFSGIVLLLYSDGKIEKKYQN